MQWPPIRRSGGCWPRRGTAARRTSSSKGVGLLRHANLLDCLQDGLTSPQLHLGLTKLGNDPLSQFPLSAWHWLPSLVCCPRTLTLDVVLFKGGAGQDLLTENSDSLLITDIKTSRSRWSAEQVEDSGEQLMLYSRLGHRAGPSRSLGRAGGDLSCGGQVCQPLLAECPHDAHVSCWR